MVVCNEVTGTVKVLQLFHFMGKIARSVGFRFTVKRHALRVYVC